MPAVRDLLLQLRGEDVSAGRTVEELASEIEAFGQLDPEATLGVDTGDAHLAVDRLHASLDEIGRITRSPRVTVDTAEARLDLAFVEARLDEIDRRHAEGTVDVDVAEALAKLDYLEHRINSVQRAGSGGGGGAGQGPIAALLPGGRSGNIFSGQFLTGILAAASPLFPTIGASLVQGAVGAGALGVSAGGVGAPILGVLGAVKSEFTEAATAATKYRTTNQAVTAAESSLSNAQEGEAQAQAGLTQARQQAAETIHQQLQSALDGLRTAEEGVTNANFQATQSETALTDARRAARRAITDEQNAAKDATLSHRSAVLGLREAQSQLQQLELTGGDPLALAQARLAVQEAEQRVHETRIASTRAHSDAQRVEKEGVNGAPSVVAARHAAEQATQGQSDAAHQLAEAQGAVNKAEHQTVANSPSVVSAETAVANAHRATAQAAERLAYAQEKANKAQGAFERTAMARSAIGVAKELRRETQSAADAAIGGIRSFLGDVVGLMHRLQPEFTTLGAQIGASFDRIGGALTGPRFQALWADLIDGATKFVRIATPGLIDFARTMANIAVAALPDLLDMARGLSSAMRDWAQGTSNLSSTRRSVHDYIEQFRNWLHLIGAIGNVLRALFISNDRGAKAGGTAVKQLTNTFNGWAHWLDTHHHQVNAFFVSILHTLGVLLDAAASLATSLGPVLDAMQPIADAIHSIVSALNSLKVGNVSALTLLLGYMTGKKILGAFGAVGGAAAAEGAAGGLTAGEAAGAGGGGVAGGLTLRGALSAIGTRLPAGAAGATGIGALAAVGYQSLAGKPGTFLAPGIAGFVPKSKDLREQLKEDLAIQAHYRDESLSTLEQQRQRMQGQWALMFEEDPKKAQSAGNRALRKVAMQTGHDLSEAIRGWKLGAALADTVARNPGDLKHALDGIRDKFGHLNTAVQDALIRAAKKRLDTYRKEGLLTEHQEHQLLNGLEEMQQASFKKQERQWAKLSATVYGIVHGGFGAAFNTVQNIIGDKGITGAVNQLLTGVASTKKLQFNAVTLGQVAGNLLPALMGGATGGFMPGYSRTDNMQIGVRGGEAILRPEDHVPFVDTAIRVATRGRVGGLTDLFNRTGAAVGHGRSSFAKGGKTIDQYVYPFAAPPSAMTLDRGIDIGGTPVFGIGDSSAVNLAGQDWLGQGPGLVYRLDAGQPAGYSPASPFIYVYERFAKAGGISGGFKAGDRIGYASSAFPNIESGWAADLAGTPLADTLYPRTGPYPSIETRHDNPSPPSGGLPTGASFWRFLNDLYQGHHVASGGAAGGAPLRLIPKIKVKGPKGALLDSIQGVADRARDEANAYLRKHERTSATRAGAIPGGKPGRNVKNLPPSLRPYDRIWPHAGGFDSAAWAALPQMPVSKIAELAEWAGMPGISMAQIAHGESDYKPGSLELGAGSGPDASRPRGVGLWAITPPYGDGLRYPEGSLSGDYSPEMYNPIYNAIVAAQMYRQAGGLAPWHGTRYWDGTIRHYQGAMRALGGFVPMLAKGVRNFAGGLAVLGDKGPELANLATGADVYSGPQAKRILDAAAMGGGATHELSVHILGDIVSEHPDPVQAFLGDERVDAHVRHIAGEEVADSADHEYRLSRMGR